jgi:RNA polymerase sigma-70 factor (ECF subfamily)
MRNLEERLLVWRFKRGNTDALHEIYRRYRVDLVTLASALLFNKSDAEDVVHDVFVTLLRSAWKLRLTGSLKGFLATCVANRARNRNKAGRRQTGNVDTLEGITPEEEQPDWSAIFGEELHQVGAALAALPYEQREVVLLHLRGGLTFREIASTQAVSINTVQGRYRYGLEKLRTFLDEKANPWKAPMTSPR